MFNKKTIFASVIILFILIIVFTGRLVLADICQCSNDSGDSCTFGCDGCNACPPSPAQCGTSGDHSDKTNCKVLFSDTTSNNNSGFNAAQKFQGGLFDTGKEAGYQVADEAFSDDSLLQKIGQIVRAILSVVGVIFLILIIYGGYTWMMARGNEQEVDKARKIIQNALIGLIIILAAYAITALVENFWIAMQGGGEGAEL